MTTGTAADRATVDVQRHTTRPEMLFPVTTAPTAAGVTIEPVNEAVVNGADVSNLALDLAATARRNPDHPATVTDTATMTYAELHAATARFATLLQRNGIGAGPTGKLLRREVVPPPEEV